MSCSSLQLRFLHPEASLRAAAWSGLMAQQMIFGNPNIKETFRNTEIRPTTILFVNITHASERNSRDLPVPSSSKSSKKIHTFVSLLMCVSVLTINQQSLYLKSFKRRFMRNTNGHRDLWTVIRSRSSTLHETYDLSIALESTLA